MEPDHPLLRDFHSLPIAEVSLAEEHTRVAEIPFESERRYAAALHRYGGEEVVSVKGSVERVLAMCAVQASPRGGGLPGR